MSAEPGDSGGRGGLRGLNAEQGRGSRENTGGVYMAAPPEGQVPTPRAELAFPCPARPPLPSELFAAAGLNRHGGGGAFLPCRDVAGRSTHDRSPLSNRPILRVTHGRGFSNPGLQAALRRHAGDWDFPAYVVLLAVTSKHSPSRRQPAAALITVEAPLTRVRVTGDLGTQPCLGHGDGPRCAWDAALMPAAAASSSGLVL